MASTIRNLLALAAVCALLPAATAFSAFPAVSGSLAGARATHACTLRRGLPLAAARGQRAEAPAIMQLKAKGPRALHTEFTVEKATPEQLEELSVKNWGVWSTAGSPKYKVGIKSPLKVPFP
ncbi:hypothetical protein T484DRAFT_1754002 [Baffinella frigidus]|nr:hypothetical protein T484DRAFT_1754002 [Cryptophyta sp. CCMP2293]